MEYLENTYSSRSRNFYKSEIMKKMKKHESKVTNIRVVLTRKPITRGQITLLKALYEADNQCLSKSELAEKIRWSDEVGLTGVIAALGKRVNKTWRYEVTKPGVDLNVRLILRDKLSIK